jgi:hypothetical protein
LQFIILLHSSSLTPSIVLGCSMAYIFPGMLWIETSVMVIIINTKYVRFLDKSICVPRTVYLNLEKIIINKLRSIECKRKLQLYVMLKEVCVIVRLLIV